MLATTSAVIFDGRIYADNVETIMDLIQTEPNRALDYAPSVEIVVISVARDTKTDRLTVTYAIEGDISTEHLSVETIEIVHSSDTKESI